MIIEHIDLPSNGLLGYPKTIKISDMGAEELSAAYYSLSDASIEYILEKVILDKDIKVQDLCDQDKEFILYKTRQITIGSIIEQYVRSPFSDRLQKSEFDLSNATVDYLTTEMLQEELVIELNGKKLVFTRVIPNQNIWNNIRIVKQKYNYEKTADPILRLVANISPIVSGKKYAINELTDLIISTIRGKDLLRLFKFVDSLVFGINKTYEIECAQTKQPFLGVLTLSSDLFR